MRQRSEDCVECQRQQGLHNTRNAHFLVAARLVILVVAVVLAPRAPEPCPPDPSQTVADFATFIIRE